MVKFALSLFFLLISHNSYATDSFYLVDPMRCHGVLSKKGQPGRTHESYNIALELKSVVFTGDKRKSPLQLQVKLAYLKPNEKFDDSTPMTPDMIWHTESFKKRGHLIFNESFTNLGSSIELYVVKSTMFTDSLVGSWVTNNSLNQATEYKLVCTARTASPNQLAPSQFRF